jgi:hypothetical protein
MKKSMPNNILSQEYNQLLSDLKQRVASSRYKAALSVNKELILLYHHVGVQILESQAKQGWGAKVIDQLSKDLGAEFPEMKGFSIRNLKYIPVVLGNAKLHFQVQPSRWGFQRGESQFSPLVAEREFTSRRPFK